jgi:hypothetical protein
MLDETRQGIRVIRKDDGIQILNNRRCRVAVQVKGMEPKVIPAANPGDWWPSVQLTCDPTFAVTVILEREGPQGPDPKKTGHFEPGDNSRNLVFE